MATIKIPADNTTITEQPAVTAFLAARGIDYERWTPERHWRPTPRQKRFSQDTHARSTR